MVKRYLTATGDKGQRLDQFLAAGSPDLSRTLIRKIIDIGGVHIDGRRVRKAGIILDEALQIELHRDRGALEPFRLSEDLVLFQDDYLIVVNKPTGIETQPTPARYKGTLFESLQVWLKRDRRFGRRLEIGMVQRLDRDTSGVIAFSIHPQAHKSMSTQFRSRSTKKIYLALVLGRPEPSTGRYVSNLIRDRYSNRMKSTSRGGKEAVTSYRVVRTCAVPDPISLVEVELVTGRTHQIRAHLSEAGYPLVGDIRYGGPERVGEHSFSAHCLHSHRLEVVHPISEKPLSFCADVPPVMDIDRW
ncbi:MAG: RluA family pseudouridine synthase [Desulfofustis sp.]|nr:RluA family pseudouridine synthase [Desulfofustis sp.]